VLLASGSGRRGLRHEIVARLRRFTPYMLPRNSDHTLRRLAAPRRLSIEADERGYPIAVFRERGQRWLRVRSIQDRWRIDDCWWQVET
jgi:hypothetical protein